MVNMQALSDILTRVRLQQEGATSIEYGMILALIVLVMMVALQEVAGLTIDMWSDVSEKTETAISGQ